MFKHILTFFKINKVTGLGEEKKFTLQELAKFDGRDGKPAYVALNGKVYDVSESAFWLGGDHLGAHQAGKDLTEDIDLAPHGPENLNRVKLVGALV
jgi:predicted heme/steroid binding protein